MEFVCLFVFSKANQRSFFFGGVGVGWGGGERTFVFGWAARISRLDTQLNPLEPQSRFGDKLLEI